MTNNVHAEAVVVIENTLKAAGIPIVGFSGAMVYIFDSEVQVGGEFLPPGKYVSVDFKAIVPVSGG